MEIELIREVVKYFSELNPDKANLIDEEQSGMNLLGIIYLKDKDGNNLLRIKKDDIGTYHLKQKTEKQKQSKKLQAEKYNPQCFNASIIKVAYGLDPGYALALLQDNSQLIIYPALLRWKNSIIMREKISEVAVEEVHSDTKKNLTGSIAAGAAFGFRTGEAELVACTTSARHQTVIFNLKSPILGDLLCEAKYDIYIRILDSCNSIL